MAGRSKKKQNQPQPQRQPEVGGMEHSKKEKPKKKQNKKPAKMNDTFSHGAQPTFLGNRDYENYALNNNNYYRPNDTYSHPQPGYAEEYNRNPTYRGNEIPNIMTYSFNAMPGCNCDSCLMSPAGFPRYSYMNDSSTLEPNEQAALPWTIQNNAYLARYNDMPSDDARLNGPGPAIAQYNLRADAPEFIPAGSSSNFLPPPDDQAAYLAMRDVV